MREEFEKMISEDIQQIEIFLEQGGCSASYYKGLTARYHNQIINFGDSLHGYYRNQGHYYQEVVGKPLEDNLTVILNRLKSFQACGHTNQAQSISSTSVNFLNSNTNVNQISINITFENAREKVEQMTALKECEIEEILEQVNRLEKIVKSNDRQSKKWENAKGIIKWIADKGVDVGITLLPLLLQIK